MSAKIIKFIILNVAFFVFPPLLAAQTSNQPYCSIFDLTANNDGRIIKTRALMIYSTVARVDGGDTFIYSQDCNNNDYFAAVNFSKLKNLRKWNKFYEKLPAEKNFIFEITFTGRLQLSLTPRYGHLSWSLAEMEMIEILSIKDVSSVSSIKEPDRKADAPLKAKGSSLLGINTEILFHFISGRRDIEQYISEDFLLIDKLGRKFNKGDYRNLTKEGIFNKTDDSTIFVGGGKVGKLKDETYVVSGKIGASLEGQKKEEELNYQDTFRFSDDSGWILIETKLSKN